MNPLNPRFDGTLIKNHCQAMRPCRKRMRDAPLKTLRDGIRTCPPPVCEPWSKWAGTTRPEFQANHTPCRERIRGRRCHTPDYRTPLPFALGLQFHFHECPPFGRVQPLAPTVASDGFRAVFAVHSAYPAFVIRRLVLADPSQMCYSCAI
jgi:hypothetical protein